MAKSVDKIMQVFIKAGKELDNRQLQLEEEITSGKKYIQELEDEINTRRNEVHRAIAAKAQLKTLIGE